MLAAVLTGDVLLVAIGVLLLAGLGWVRMFAEATRDLLLQTIHVGARDDAYRAELNAAVSTLAKAFQDLAETIQKTAQQAEPPKDDSVAAPIAKPRRRTNVH